MATTVRATPAIQHIVLHDISWEFYERLLEELGDRHFRVTYDQGTLELMSPSRDQELFKKLLARFIEAFTYELDIPIVGAGSTTYKQRVHKRGLEPDECYYVGKRSCRRALRKQDGLPSPDLALEVDITSDSLDRMPIYAALRVAEVWRFDGEQLHVHLLDSDGHYVEVDRSAAFPELPIERLCYFLNLRGSIDDTALTRRFIRWVRRYVPRR